MVFALLVTLWQAPVGTGCTQAAGAVTAAASELCLGEQAFRAGDGAAKGTAERTRQFEEAAAHYRRAADLTSDVASRDRALSALADVYDGARLNRPDLLEQVLREQIALDPQRLAPQLRLARLQEDRGSIDLAEDTLIAARRQHAADEDAYRALAQFYARRVTALHAAAQSQQPPKENDAAGQRDANGVYRVGGGIDPPKRVDVPQYPAEAMAAAIQGAVGVEVVINEAGQVTEAKVVRSIPLLDEAALKAVREWRYVPTLVNGQPVPVRSTVTVNFTLPR